MKRYELRCNNEPTSIDIGIAVQIPCVVRIRVYNPKVIGAVYLDRWSNLKGKGEFEARLPQNAEKVIVEISSDNQNDDNVRITKLKKQKLKQYIPCVGGKNTMEFVKLAQEFSEHACQMPTRTYFSDKNHFRVEYMDVIKDDNGRILTTPARIHNGNGNMQVSKSHFCRYSVPMRMAILLHEYSHFYMNVEVTDEVEADLNALKIYLGLGYPVIEAHKSFLNVFKEAPTDQNRERYEYLKAFIDNFDDIKYRICLP